MKRSMAQGKPTLARQPEGNTGLKVLLPDRLGELASLGLSFHFLGQCSALF